MKKKLILFLLLLAIFLVACTPQKNSLKDFVIHYEFRLAAKPQEGEDEPSDKNHYINLIVQNKTQSEKKDVYVTMKAKRKDTSKEEEILNFKIDKMKAKEQYKYNRKLEDFEMKKLNNSEGFPRNFRPIFEIK